MYQPTKLKDKRLELGLKQVEIANMLAITKQSYFAWEKGTSTPTKENLEKLEKILGVHHGYLSEDRLSSDYRMLNDINKKKVDYLVQELLTEQSKITTIGEHKLYKYKVFEQMSAGVGFTIYDDREYDTVYFDRELPHDFASWISGDSMEPTYKNGSVALIREIGFDYDGAVYALVWNSQTYIKKVYREAEGLRLVSINKDYSDKFAFYDDNPRIVGKIVGSFLPIER
ncbi:S24 family peptidase [Streptococcus suis]